MLDPFSGRLMPAGVSKLLQQESLPILTEVGPKRYRNLPWERKESLPPDILLQRNKLWITCGLISLTLCWLEWKLQNAANVTQMWDILGQISSLKMVRWSMDRGWKVWHYFWAMKLVALTRKSCLCLTRLLKFLCLGGKILLMSLPVHRLWCLKFWDNGV